MNFIPLKKEPSNYNKCSAFASSALLHLSFNLNSVSFIEGGRKNISCLRVEGTLAMPLPIGQIDSIRAKFKGRNY